MKTGLFVIVLSLTFIQCGNKNSVPGDVLPPEKMQSVLWDMMRADRFLVDFVLKDTSLNKTSASIQLYQQVFAIHGIDKEKFKKSFEYYEAHPAFLKVMMDSLSKLPLLPDSTKTVKLADTTHQRVAPQPVIDSAFFRKKKQKRHSKTGVTL